MPELSRFFESLLVEEEAYRVCLSSRKRRMAENVRLRAILGGDVPATAAFLSRVDRLEARFQAWAERTGYSG